MADGALFGAIPERVEPTPRWVRVRAGDVTLADSRSALLLVWFGPGRLPTYLFPASDVRTDLLRPAAGGGGDGDMVAHDVATDDGVLAGAAMLMRDPPRSTAGGTPTSPGPIPSRCPSARASGISSASSTSGSTSTWTASACRGR